MKRFRIGLIAFGMIIALSGQLEAQKYNLTLTGASPGGLWSRIGGGIDAAIAAAYPGSTITYQTSSGGLANIPLVATGKAPMGLATDGELTAAYTGQAPFKTPIKDIRILFRVYTPAARFQATHLMLNKTFADKYGITSFEDIVKKKVPMRVAINRRGNMDSDVSRLVMEEMGATADAIESWGGQVVYAASREIVSLILDRRIDLANFGIAYNHPRIREIAKGITPVLLDIPKAVAQKVVEKVGGEVCSFKSGEYKFSNNNVNSICIGALVIASKDMDEQLAYNITKGVFEQIEKFKTAHRLIEKSASPQSLSTPAVVPFHPGAAKYMQEIGLIK